MEPITAKFKCTFDALYEGCDLLVFSVTEDLAALAAFKAKYTLLEIDDYKALILAARLLPDEEQRAAEHELLRIALKTIVDKDVKKAMGDLKLYIRDAFDDLEVRKVKMGVAGFNEYNDAVKPNWEVLKTMMQKANTFIGANSVALLADNNMPVGFAAAFTAIKNDLDAKIPVFLNARENSPQDTQAKVKASNDIYDIAIRICEDGQHVFADDPAKHKQYVWEEIQDIVTPPGVAGLKFDIKEDGSNIPLVDVAVAIQNIEAGGLVLHTTTNAEGKGAFTNLEKGIYTGKATKVGYIEYLIEVEIKTGVTSFRHWLMSPSV